MAVEFPLWSLLWLRVVSVTNVSEEPTSVKNIYIDSDDENCSIMKFKFFYKKISFIAFYDLNWVLNKSQELYLIL